MEVSPNHSFYRIFHCKPSIVGYPHFRNPPIFWESTKKKHHQKHPPLSLNVAGWEIPELNGQLERKFICNLAISPLPHVRTTLRYSLSSLGVPTPSPPRPSAMGRNVLPAEPKLSILVAAG